MTHNIGVVIAIWAPIVLEVNGELTWEWLLFLFFFALLWTILTTPLVHRSISWIHKYGMPYSPLFLVAFMEHSAIWVRLVTISLSNNVKKYKIHMLVFACTVDLFSYFFPLDTDPWDAKIQIWFWSFSVQWLSFAIIRKRKQKPSRGRLSLLIVSLISRTS